MKRRFLLFAVSVTLVLVLGGLVPILAGAAFSNSSGSTLISPTVAPDSLLTYNVGFPGGQGFGAVQATLNKDGTAKVQFFDSEKDYQAAREQQDPDYKSTQYGGSMVTATCVAGQ